MRKLALFVLIFGYNLKRNKMKKDLKKIREKFNQYFNPNTRSINDLLWQINNNGMLDSEQEPVIFHVNVTNEGNEVVLAFYSGGYKRTGVFFIENDYRQCCDVIEELNKVFFDVNKKDQVKNIFKSMFS